MGVWRGVTGTGKGRGGEEEGGALGGRWGFWEIVGVVVGEGRRREVLVW